jgi:hypothetical protein
MWHPVTKTWRNVTKCHEKVTFSWHFVTFVTLLWQEVTVHLDSTWTPPGTGLHLESMGEGKVHPTSNTLTMPQQPITLTAYEFWGYVKDDTDCDEVLELLGGHNKLISHFLYFSSIAKYTQRSRKTCKKEEERNCARLYRINTVPRIPLIDCTIRSTTTPPSPISPAIHTISHYKNHPPLTPIDVDSIVDSPPSSSSSSSVTTSFVTAPTNPPTWPTTPEPPFGTAHRICHDDITHFTNNGIYYVREEFSQNINFKEDFYDFPRPPYHHHLPQLPTIPQMIPCTSHHV